jgi:hypothetical protein
MPNKLSGGMTTVGGIQSGDDGTAKFGTGKIVYMKSNTVARTDTSAKTLFTLPAYSELIGFYIYGTVASDAGTTAILDIGKTGTGNFYINDFDVKGSTGVGVYIPAAQSNLGAAGATNITVTGTYAETGGASSTGGPWTITAIYSNEAKI